MALKLKYEYESNAWHRYPHLVSWRQDKEKVKNIDPTTDQANDMAAWLRRASIDHAPLLRKVYNLYGHYDDLYAQYDDTPKVVSGFRFLTEEEASMFWLHFNNSDPNADSL